MKVENYLAVTKQYIDIEISKLNLQDNFGWDIMQFKNSIRC